MINNETKEVILNDNKPNTATFSYGKGEMDKNLNYGYATDLLKFYDLKLPSYYKDVSKKEFHEAFDKGMKELKILRKSIRNVAKYDINTNTGLIEAVALHGENAIPTSKELIKQHNIMQIFINNMDKLRDYKEITGTGIIHFNNPHQLDRLELLAGSIFAGNNGVKQEFSQIAHLLHQLKVITKKQLNDLLKKYILNNGIMERAIHISSINRENTGENRPDNFLTKFNPPMKLDRELKQSLLLLTD